MSTILFKKLDPAATIPTKGSDFAAGFDLYSLEEIRDWHPGQRIVVKTGVACALPPGVYGRIAPRSGLAVKAGVDVLAGVIDEDYRGELMVALINLNGHHDDNGNPVLANFPAGTRIAQFIPTPYVDPEVIECDDLPPTKRGADGFGSTGSW